MFLKNKGLTMHLVCPQYHLLYIYMACLLTSSSLSLTYRAGLLNFETCFLREFRLLPTYFIHDKDIFKKSIIFIIPLPGFFLFLFFCFKKLRAVFPCKMRKLAFLSFQRKWLVIQRKLVNLFLDHLQARSHNPRIPGNAQIIGEKRPGRIHYHDTMSTYWLRYTSKRKVSHSSLQWMRGEGFGDL